MAAFFSSKVRTSTTGGLVLGMSYTHVTPACTAASVPVRKSSFCVIPGSRRCTWGSMNPGSSISLVPSLILSSPPET